MAIKERKCLSCATTFKYCPSCSRVDALKPAWASQFCSESCKDLWMTLTKLSMNRLTKQEAKSIISELDLKPIDAYVACVQKDYAKVFEPEKKSRKTKKAEPVVEVTEPIEVEPIIEQPIEVAEPVVAESTAHEVVLQENE